MELVGTERCLVDAEHPLIQSQRLPVLALRHQLACGIVQAVCQLGMGGTKRRLVDAKRPHVQRQRLHVLLALLLQHVSCVSSSSRG